MQRIRIEEIRNDEWFKKNYNPVGPAETEDFDLDDVNAAFDDPEVSGIILLCLDLGFPLRNFISNNILYPCLKHIQKRIIRKIWHESCVLFGIS